MAKLTLLQLINHILRNLGESTVSSTTSLSGLSYLVFNTINELLYDIGFNDRLSPLETMKTITFSSGVSTYAYPTDIFAFDKDSFKYNGKYEVVYYTPQKFDREYKQATNSGEPNKIYKFAGNWNLYPIPNTNGSITYRAWQFPTIYDTDTASGTSYMPEGFDRTLLADYVTYKILHYKNNPEAQVYYVKVFGDGRNNEGSLDKFKRLYRSPDLSDGSIMVEAFENTNYRITPRSSQGY